MNEYVSRLRVLADGLQCVVNYSGGVCSFMAAKRAVERFGSQSVTLLFCDTGEEDADLYRFLRQSAAFLGCELIELRRLGGMDALIDEHCAIPSPRMAFCTRELKIELADKWMAENATSDTIRVYGMDWTEINRVEGLKERLGDCVWCPMTEKPYLSKAQMIEDIRSVGLTPSRAYAEGFQHDNCGGGCVKAGLAAWAHTLRMRPEVYAKWEERETRVSEQRGKPCSILRDRRSGTTKPLLLSEYRKRLEQGVPFDKHDWGGCGCFVG